MFLWYDNNKKLEGMLVYRTLIIFSTQEQNSGRKHCTKK